MLAEVEVDQSLLTSSGTWQIDTASGSATLNEVSTTNLYVTEQAAVNSLSVTSAISVGNSLFIQSSQDTSGEFINSIDSLASPLRLQTLALAPIEFMAGKVSIDTSGNMKIEGDLSVTGKVVSSSLSSDSAEFSDLTTKRVAVTTDTATGSYDIYGNYIIESLTSAGKGLIPAGLTEVTIKNINTKANALIYVTPTTSTGNNVLYVKVQDGCEEATGACQPMFIVGFDQITTSDVEFNWWIVDTKQASIE